MNQTELLRMAAMHGEGRGLNHWDQAKGWREAARVIREKRAAAVALRPFRPPL